jgi:hypothetical protein
MIRLGMLDFDSSHTVQFAKRLNHQGIAKEQWVDGAQIRIACPGQSRIMPELIASYRAEITKLGIPLVDRPEEMISKVDGMLIESQQGSVHYERARPFLEAGLPCYIDKPFTCSVADARKIIDLAQKKRVPVFSSSSLRYAPNLVEFLADPAQQPILGALAYGPAPLHEGNPGLFHYGIHAVEILYALMGPGCESVASMHQKDVDFVTGQWRDGRVASVRGIRAGKHDYGCLVFTARAISSLAMDTRFIYRELLKNIVSMFATNRSPLDVHITLEMIAFIEAALRSAHNHGTAQKLDS